MSITLCIAAQVVMTWACLISGMRQDLIFGMGQYYKADLYPVLLYLYLVLL